MLIENKNIESINVIENLKKLGVEFRSFIVSGDPRGDGKDICVIAAGLELLTWLPMEDLDTPMGSMFKDIFNKGDKQKIEFSNRMPYKEPEEMMDDANIYLLSKYIGNKKYSERQISSLISECQEFGQFLTYGVYNKEAKQYERKQIIKSLKHHKEEASVLPIENKYDIPTRETLETAILTYYIYENNPTTNTIAISKQFGLRHDHILETLRKICNLYPSMYSGVKISPYKTTLGKGGTSFNTYMELTEYVYQSIIRTMGTPKTVEMRIYREGKLEEYYRAFTNLRADHYNRGGTTQEMFEDIDMGKKTTEILFKTISIYVDSFNNRYKRSKYYKETKSPLQPLPYDLVKRIMINLINKYVGVNSFDFSNNRDSLHSEEVRKLSIAEGGFSMHIEDVKDASPKDVLLTVYHGMVPTIGRQGDEVVEKHIIKDLKEYNVGYLWTELNKYPAL